jgi:hypothetical protein
VPLIWIFGWVGSWFQVHDADDWMDLQRGWKFNPVCEASDSFEDFEGSNKLLLKFNISVF